MLKIPVKKFWLILLCLTLFFMVWVNQSIRSTSLNYEIAKLEEELKKEERKGTQLKMEQDKIFSLESIEAKAKEMGFESVKGENIVTIAVENVNLGR